VRSGTCRRRGRGSRRFDFLARNQGPRFRPRRIPRSTSVVVFISFIERILRIDRIESLVGISNQGLECFWRLGWWKMKASSLSSAFYGGGALSSRILCC
jgi:hypothetical protein